MALTRTAGQLTSSLRLRADHLVGTFRTDAQLYGYLSDSCRALIGVLVKEHKELYWSKVDTLVVAANVTATALPTDFWKLIMLRLTIDQRREPVHQADLDAIDVEAQSVGGWSARWPRYRMLNRALYWAPTPRASHSVSIYYVPTGVFLSNLDNPKEDLTASDDKFDGIFGWDRWVVLDSAIKLLSDERKDTSVLQAEADRRMAEILAEAEDRAMDEAPKVRDRWDPSDDGSGGRMPPGGFY